jgi:hypothetical protein
VAIGGAGRADALGALGPVLNPAGITLEHRFYADAIYGFTVQGLGSALHLSIVDSVTNLHIAAGLYYSFVHSSPRVVYPAIGGSTEAAREGHEWGTSIAIPIGERFSFGLTTKYVRAGTTVPNPNAAVPGQPATVQLDSSTTTATADGFTADLGLVLRLGDSLNLGLGGYNLIPLHSVEAPIGLGGGLTLLLDTQVLISADFKVDFDRYRNPAKVNPDGTLVQGDSRATARIGGGIEYIAGGIVPLRAGFVQDTGRPGSYISAGIGYQSRQFAIDLAYRQKVNDGNESLIIAGIRYMGE